MPNTEEIKEILTNLGYSLQDRGDQWSCTALYRGGDNPNAISINKKTGEYFDFVINQGGPLEKLIEQTLGTPITEEIKTKLKSGISEVKSNYETDLEHVKTFDKKLLLKLDKTHDYWLGRGVKKSTIEKFQGGITRTGRMQQRYTFPIFNERDDLVGFTGRDLTGEAHSKWKILGPKSTWVYPLINKKAIIESKSVALIESVGDGLRLTDNNINNYLITFGLNVSAKVIEFLLKTNVDKIYLGFNNDKSKNFAGNLAAIKERKKLLKYFDENQVKIALLDSSNDFGAASDSEIQSWYANLQSI